MNSMLTIITVLLSAGYGALMLLYRVGWHRQRLAQTHMAFHALRNETAAGPAARFSIIVPARNEAANITPLLDSIAAQNFPPDAYEVILIDDHSTDETTAVAAAHGLHRTHRLTILRLAEHTAPGTHLNSAKKYALALGIAHAAHPHIVTTDADCIVPPDWLAQISAAFANDHAVLAAGSVNFMKDRGALYLFQSLDFMAMQGITAAAHALHLGTMANGANLAFSRAAFEEVDGYTGIDHLASGDDYLLTHKLARRFGRARQRYVLHPGAIVRTAAQPSWVSFLQQRIRWASKSGKYNDARLTAILVLVYATNVWLLTLGLIAPFVAGAFKLLLGSVAAKTLVEILFLWPVAKFFGKRRELFVFPFLQPLHILYVVLAGFLGMRGGYRWKGRGVR